MSFAVELPAGTAVRLPVKGKYCDRDIVVTAVAGENKLAQYFAKTISTLTPEDLAGVTALPASAFNGYPITSAELPDTVVSIGASCFYKT